MTKSQYATIPIELLEIDSKKKKITSSYTFHLFKITPYKSLKLNTIAVKIGDEKTPYLEEIITKNKIGFNGSETNSMKFTEKGFAPPGVMVPASSINVPVTASYRYARVHPATTL